MSVVIKVENLSKQYRLGTIGAGTLKHDVNRAWHRLRGKEDPYITLGESNDRSTKSESKSAYVWALKDINFDIEQGDVVGIIGRNGAGKSTLLKILSRTTSPTTGSVKIKGRVASLLEVGTGFHGELTGKENIFLNGAIMGMNKAEIKRKLDEIIDFAGVERYIDTPVKRYSSGMFVRLAFGVAAHLEPEILIMDEVLAVGDAEFQKKALGKMKDVSVNEGRTVLFVSHNMTAIKNLCRNVLFMQNGRIHAFGSTETVVNNYLSMENKNAEMIQSYASQEEAPGNEEIKMKRIEVVPMLQSEDELLTVNTPVNIEFEFWNNIPGKLINLSLVLLTPTQECVFNVGTKASHLQQGLYKGICHIPGNLLNDGMYIVSMMVVGDRSSSLYYFENAVSFEVHEKREASAWHAKWIGIVRPQMEFSLKQVLLD